MFHFTLREMVLLTVVVGLGLGWWIDQWQLRARVERAEFLWHHLEQFKWEQERIYRRNQQFVGLFLDAGGNWVENRHGTIESLQMPIVLPNANSHE
jgi:hypothetical protein